MRVPNFWPRLYLDTADLLDIADGRTDPDVLRNLLAASEEHLVVLVLSSAHLQDALMPASADRLSTALEQFRFRTLVTKGPDSIEPWPNKGIAQDIEIEGCQNIREILTAPSAAPALASMREVQDAIYRASLSVNAMQRDFGQICIPRHHKPIALQSTITQIRGWMGDDPVPVVLHHLEKDGGTPTAGEMVNLLKVQLPVTELLREVGPFVEAHGFDRTALARQMALSMASDGFTLAPGAWLGGQLYAGLFRDAARDPLRSDSVDCLHATHFPYVDIASCDAHSHAILSRHIERARGPRLRTVSLFRDRRLAQIVDHIRALPMGIDLYLNRSDDVHEEHTQPIVERPR